MCNHPISSRAGPQLAEEKPGAPGGVAREVSLAGEEQSPLPGWSDAALSQETRAHGGPKHVREEVGLSWVSTEKPLPTSPAQGRMEKDTGGQFPPKIIRPLITF